MKALTVFSRAFRSDLISILVGPHKIRYTAHKNILTRISFFAKCLNGQFKEGHKNEITLPKDNPLIFVKILEYICYDKIDTKTFCDSLIYVEEQDQQTLMAQDISVPISTAGRVVKIMSWTFFGTMVS